MTSAITVPTPAPESGDQLHLLVVGGGVMATEPLPSVGSVTIGRAPDCDVRIDDESISRKHAVLEISEPLRIVDVGSANGTTVRGRRIAPHDPVEVQLDEVLKLGSVVVIVQRRARARPLADHGDRIEGDVVVVDERMAAMHELAARVAAADINVLLQGETGVGKEVIAELVHRKSARADKPFLKLNCAAFPEPLLESELFGHERGAFTGATQSKPGLFEVAEGGVVFLDEIGELLPSIQAKLLRVLDERKVMRVGGLTPRPIDVRLVSATNRDLEAEVARGAFRRDLLFRLNAMSIDIPPLRERPSEIVPLARRFMHGMCERLRRPTPRLTEAAIAMLQRYAWPGNVRELRNVVERALVLATGDLIDVRDLPEEKMRAGAIPAASRAPAPARPVVFGARKSELAAEERRQILEALEACGGNQTNAAKLLGIARRTLINKLEKFAVPRPRKR